MDLRSSSPSEIIGDLKDRFGFGKKADSYDSYGEYGDEEYYDYEQYAPTAEQEYADAQEYYPDSYSTNPYDRLEYTTRPSSRSSSRVQSAPLVSARDIRATTPSVLSSNSATTRVMPVIPPSSAAPSVEDEGYDVPATAYTDFVSPYKDRAEQHDNSYASSSLSAPLHNAEGSDSLGSPSSSSGLDSLFSPTTSSSAHAASSYPAQTQATSSVAGTDGSYKFAESSSAGLSSPHQREIVMVKPQVYDDVASIAQSLRSGALVVLSLNRCEAALSKRVLDFSFGVASALDARVECVATKVFVLVTGSNLTLDEQHRIRKMGA